MGVILRPRLTPVKDARPPGQAPLDNTIAWLNKFARKPQIAEANVKVLKAGWNSCDITEAFHTRYEVPAATLEPVLYRNITGNTALALGLIAASRRSGLPLYLGAYPITPASDVLHELAHFKNYGVVTFQAEDEIAAVCAAIGASFGGALGVNVSSGPGIDMASPSPVAIQTSSGNHLIHTLRRNIGVKILMFNNRIYGLTKGQYSPTSELGKKTKSTPAGSVDYPFNPLSLALDAGATFVARSVDIFQSHLRDTLRRAAEHKGTAFVEIYQNCNIFNDKAFTYMTEKESKDEQVIYLEHGKPLVFGKAKDKGIRMNGTHMEVIQLGDGLSADDCLVWDENLDNPATAFLAAQLLPPNFPTAVGVFRSVDMPSYEERVTDQMVAETARLGVGKLDDLLKQGDTWVVPEGQTVS